MKIRSAVGLLTVISTWLLACGNDISQSVDNVGDTGGAGAGTTTGVGGSTTSTGGGGSGDWETLIQGDWSLSPGTEGYVCVAITVPEDMYVRAFRPLAPLGTHHSVLSRAPSAPLGTYPCDAGTNGNSVVYGSGVGTDAFELPAGVAVKLDAGETLMVNLHLFNVAVDQLTGTSGIQIQRVDAAEVQHQAQSVLGGTLNIFIPPNSQATAVGNCTLPTGSTLFAVFPHMHQYGTHMRVSVGGNVLHDDDYSFDGQLYYPLPTPITIGAGDTVTIECSYDNPTPNAVTFGDSSLQEMCFAGLYHYPDTGLPWLCTN